VSTKEPTTTTKKEQTTMQKRTRAYDMARKVLAKRHPEEFKAIYARILDEEYGLKPQSQPHRSLAKYV
jgi:hypothetical protein